jgi:hypothetical protein
MFHDSPISMLDDRRVHKITPQVIRVPRAAALTSSTAMDGQSAEELLQPLEDLAKFDETRDSQLPLVISFLLADAGTSVLFLRFFCGVFFPESVVFVVCFFNQAILPETLLAEMSVNHRYHP